MPTQQVQQAPPSQSETLTPTQMAAMVAAAVAQHMPQPQAPQQRQLTPEEEDRMLNTYRPDLSIVHALFGADPERDNPRLEALMQMVQGLIRNSATHAQFISQNALREFYPHIQTDLEAARELAQEQFYEGIYKEHDGLRHYDPVIRHMLPSFEQMPNYPKSRREASAFVREQFTNIMKQQNPQFDPKVGPSNPLPHQGAFRGQPPSQSSGQYPQQTQQYQTQQPAQSSLSLAAMGGGGGQGAAARPASNPSETPWDPDGRGLC